MRRSGFTMLELIIVIVIVGVLALVGFPRIKDAIQKTNVRSARVAAGTYVATARAAAIQLGTLYKVTLSETQDSVQFDPRGLRLNNNSTTVRFAASSGEQDSIVINQ